jgi:hypothetical protein
LIVGGDLNLTLSAREVWGDHARLDSQSFYFSELFSKMGLVDILPFHLSPTWRNGRSGSAGISKRLDRFLIHEDLLGSFDKCRSWTINSVISYHNPICLQLEESSDRYPSPFKFNRAWLTEPDFILLVRSSWRSMAHWRDPSTMKLLVTKLKKLKTDVILWKKEKNKTIQEELGRIEQKLEEIFYNCPSQIFSPMI